MRMAEPAAMPADASSIPTSLPELVALAAAKRDVRLQVALERDIRLLSFEIGRIEIALTPNAEADLPNRIAKALLDWTGRRWGVSVAREIAPEAAAPTLQELIVQAREDARRGVTANPAIRAILERFPGAEIVAVRAAADAAPPDADLAGTEEETSISDDDL